MQWAVNHNTVGDMRLWEARLAAKAATIKHVDAEVSHQVSHPMHQAIAAPYQSEAVLQA